MVMIYDSAKVPVPPTTISGLIDWVKKNPGKFTYPALPDFTGSVFVRHLFYYAAGGYEQLLGPFNQAVFDRVAPKAWELLNEIEPYLWREGKTYPENRSKHQDLFDKGENLDLAVTLRQSSQYLGSIGLRFNQKFQHGVTANLNSNV